MALPFLTSSHKFLQKSKADNKYFAAMRAKDAESAEKVAIQRAMERQTQVIERYGEAEKSFAAQIQMHEQEVSLLRKSLEEHKTRLADLTIQSEGLRAREAEAVTLLHSANQRLHVEVQTAETASADKARLEERVMQLEKDLERSKKVIASGAASGSGGRKGSTSSSDSTNEQLQMLNQLLRCSACNERYRSKIIVKCLHTFCAQCIEARIQTRQRKCPHCGLAFAISDVQTFYLQ